MAKTVIILALCVVLSACVAGKGPSKEETPLPVVPSFAAQVADMAEGSVQHFAESPIGFAEVEAGSFYLSGLNQKCRTAFIIQGNMTQKFAVCQEKNEWRLVPSVFEKVSR